MTFYIGEGIVFPTVTLLKVLESLGGKVENSPNGVDICIDNNQKISQTTNQTNKQKNNQTTLPELWVFDSIVAWKKLDFHP